MSELYSTLFFGDNPEFEDFLAQDLEGFLGQLASSHESSRDLLFPLLVLMGDEDDASMMTELATDDGDPQTQPANAEFVERLETVKIEESGLECSICLDQLSIGSEGRRLPCSHLYHGNCIEEWLKKSKTCPLCRAS
ncbi:hypothetical protein P3X46_021633 [Hevea brasiliensis]|uniref:RING-type E3 ubiquitin transferase n=1 Tax=Hevea brasiliensis TaxID=3981 RepID=A0ABQ9LK51_HEVBR|nr:E3 ubiquitin-protein ligase SIRP1-like [Hevea brasiliensis]KAJ9166944.1 hypothetical protein P3X46_021633 [Hevea brasiliensis]